jgi:hypothetical protein
MSIFNPTKSVCRPKTRFLVTVSDPAHHLLVVHMALLTTITAVALLLAAIVPDVMSIDVILLAATTTIPEIVTGPLLAAVVLLTTVIHQFEHHTARTPIHHHPRTVMKAHIPTVATTAVHQDHQEAHLAHLMVVMRSVLVTGNAFFAMASYTPVLPLIILESFHSVFLTIYRRGSCFIR